MIPLIYLLKAGKVEGHLVAWKHSSIGLLHWKEFKVTNKTFHCCSLCLSITLQSLIFLGYLLQREHQAGPPKQEREMSDPVFQMQLEKAKK